MPRSPRVTAKSGYYHVTMRGNAKAVIFENDAQRKHFLDLLRRYKDECKYTILAWCLMDNHVHMVLDASNTNLSAALQRLATAYAVYFNRLEDRIGHLFQSPFQSKPIEFEEQLINTVRYVHQNPERAGICTAREYRWSSYAEYAEEPWLTDTSMLLDMVGREELLRRAADDEYVVRDATKRTQLSDAQAQEVVRESLGISSCSQVGSMSKNPRNRAIRTAIRLNLPPKQLARLFGVGERTIYRIAGGVEKERQLCMTPLKMAKGV